MQPFLGEESDFASDPTAENAPAEVLVPKSAHITLKLSGKLPGAIEEQPPLHHGLGPRPLISTIEKGNRLSQALLWVAVLVEGSPEDESKLLQSTQDLVSERLARI